MRLWESCLIRMGSIRPKFLPAICGIRSENAAHRIAVRWRDGGQEHEGVYIPRRDSSSRLNTLVGGRLFPGLHHRTTFRVAEQADRYEIEMNSRDGRGSLSVQGRKTETWPGSSVFDGVAQASAFFKRGSLGYSATRESGIYDGLELRCREWSMEPVAVESVRTSYFDNTAIFPRGGVQFDCALVMRNIAHEWHGRGQMCCAEATTTATAA